MPKAGNFEIDVWKDGYPVWCIIRCAGYPDREIKIHHSELSDLKYAVEKAMKEARQALGDRHKEEV